MSIFTHFHIRLLLVLFFYLCQSAFGVESEPETLSFADEEGSTFFAASEGERLETNQPDLERVFCPAIFRLSLKRKAYEHIVTQSIQADSENKNWTFTVKKGIKWWSGAELSTQDFKVFLEKYMGVATRKHYGFEVEVPTFTIETSKTPQQVVVRWSKAPRFGAFILAQVPFLRSAARITQKNPNYECVGLYRPKFMTKDRAEFESTVTTNGKKTFVIERNIERNSDKKASCESYIDSPQVSVLALNSKNSLFNDARKRQSITELLPRGDLSRMLIGKSGGLISAPILRLHPGYKSKILVRPYNPKSFTTLPETTKINVFFPKESSASQDILEKALVDILAQKNIQSLLVDQKSKADLVYQKVRLPWPSENLITILHSKSQMAKELGLQTTRELDSALEAYADQLTHLNPDFSGLQTIHQIFFNLEPFTVLWQHRSCLKQKNKRPGPIEIADADWFKQIL